MRRIARRLGLGKVALYAWHRPRGIVRQLIVEGGPLEQRRTERGRREMVEAAKRLAPLEQAPDIHRAAVQFLTGRKYWYQTLFCFASLQMRLPFKVTPLVFDDGSIDTEIKDLLFRVVPWTKIISNSEIEAILDGVLPPSRYPSLRARRLVYPHLRKLVDLHVGQSDLGLVLDSDILFHGDPTELIDWFKRPTILHMQDVADAYGYSATLMTELAGGPVLPKVNVGLYALDRGRIDWDRVEHDCARQLEAEGPSYLQEQGLTAIELTRQGSRALDASRYLLLPDTVEGAEPTAVLHHYVAHSKRSFFQHGWRLIIEQLNRPVSKRALARP